MKLIPLFVLCVTFILTFSCFAIAAEEKLTITTYYPSPQGSYDQLQSNRLAIGDTNNSGTLDADDLPNRDGDIRFKPQSGDPTAWPAGKTGQLTYSSMNDAFYYYNGSGWVAQGGGGGACYVSYVDSCLSGFTDEGTIGQWGKCGGCTSEACWYHYVPPGGMSSICTNRLWRKVYGGEARVCCK